MCFDSSSTLGTNHLAGKAARGRELHHFPSLSHCSPGELPFVCKIPSGSETLCTWFTGLCQGCGHGQGEPGSTGQGAARALSPWVWWVGCGGTREGFPAAGAGMLLVLQGGWNVGLVKVSLSCAPPAQG